MYKYSLKCPTEGFYPITSQVASAIEQSGIRKGIAVVFCPHTTGAITINENCDKYVAQDIMLGLARAFPDSPDYKHDEGNSTGHIKSGVFGASETLIIEEGRLVLGRWQDIYFVEFDPPRDRNFYVKIIEG
ncbi:MAG: secondary thiamine-phosphate synthase enzyme YjbQ [Christensenellales bacterium]|jgi:secondary thiamine-phosphate synthase enzyme